MSEERKTAETVLDAAEIEAVSLFGRCTIVGAHLESDEVRLAAHVCGPGEAFDEEVSTELCMQHLLEQLMADAEAGPAIELTKKQAELVVAMAHGNMKVSSAAEKLGVAKSSVSLRCRKLQEQTGKDPARFFDLCELLLAARDVLKEE